ncbi:MAG: ClpXP protease specificity-enhancing factor SspB [Kiloniellales bacterium]
MTSDGLRYDALVEDALRDVLRRALAYVAERGLPGDHHFYITFRTGHPGVDIPEHLRTRFPNEMTIVLQHQFWGLDVGEDAVGVTLTFSDVPERLTIPFAAVTSFADPSVQFGLQFDSSEEGGERMPVMPVMPTSETLPADLPGSGPPRPAKDAVREAGAAPAPEPILPLQPDEPEEGAKVVTLDAFRKK